MPSSASDVIIPAPQSAGVKSAEELNESADAVIVPAPQKTQPSIVFYTENPKKQHCKRIAFFTH